MDKAEPLTIKTLALAARQLAQRDPELARIHAHYGPPPLWRRASGFVTLVHIILEQQVSLGSAKAMLARLQAVIYPFTPEQFLEFGESGLRALGVTRQKASYLINLASSLVSANLNLRRLHKLDDRSVKQLLMDIKGIGSWSADVYLLMAMRRPDVWPAGDLALAVAIKEVKRLEARPTPKRLEQFAESWRPHRAVAARMLWQYYLGRKQNPLPTLNSEIIT